MRDARSHHGYVEPESGIECRVPSQVETVAPGRGPSEDGPAGYFMCKVYAACTPPRLARGFRRRATV